MQRLRAKTESFVVVIYTSTETRTPQNPYPVPLLYFHLGRLHIYVEPVSISVRVSPSVLRHSACSNMLKVMLALTCILFSRLGYLYFAGVEMCSGTCPNSSCKKSDMLAAHKPTSTWWFHSEWQVKVSPKHRSAIPARCLLVYISGHFRDHSRREEVAWKYNSRIWELAVHGLCAC